MWWKKWTGSRGGTLLLLVILVISLGACASKTSFVPERLIPPDELTGVQTKTLNDVTVSVSILTDEQAKLTSESISVVRAYRRCG